MEPSEQYTPPVEIIKEEEKREGYTIGPTTVEYSPLKLQRQFKKLVDERLPQEQRERLTQAPKLYFNFFDYAKHLIKHSPISPVYKGARSTEHVTPLATWKNFKKNLLNAFDIAHASELVFPNESNPAIMINLAKIQNDLKQLPTPEEQSAALKAALGEFWTAGCEQIVKLQDPQVKIQKGLETAAKKVGVGAGISAYNFAAVILPIPGVSFPYSFVTGPILNLTANLLRRKKIEPHSNPDSILFDVHYNTKMTQYTPLPPFLPLD